MAFCQKCGAEIAAGAQFCGSCGTAVGAADDGSTRKKVFVGEQRKCPHCGEVLNGYVAVCPACGNELNKSVNKDITQFTSELNKADSEILSYCETHPEKIFWKSWKVGAKIGYVILNIYTLGIPFIIHLIASLVKTFAAPNFNPAEKKKQSVIMNAVVPNDMDGIMEFLNFSTSQRDSQAVGNDKANLWKVVWNNKIQQIITKSKSLYSSDSHFIEFLDQKAAEIHQIRKSILVKRLIPLAVILVAAIGIGIPLAIKITGGGVRIEQSESSKVVSKDNVEVIGYLSKYVQLSDSGVSIKYDEGSGRAIVTYELVSNADISAVIEKKISDAITKKGWLEKDCKYTDAMDFTTYRDHAILLFYSADKYVEIKNIETDNEEQNLQKIVGLKNGETIKIQQPMYPKAELGLKSTYKKFTKELLQSNNYTLNVNISTYEIRNTEKQENLEITLD